MPRFPAFEAELRRRLPGLSMPVRVDRLELMTRWGKVHDDLLLLIVGDGDQQWPTEDLLKQVVKAAQDVVIPDEPTVSHLLCFPPILVHQRVDGVDVFFLGSVEKNIVATVKDLQAAANILASVLDQWDFFVYSSINDSAEAWAQFKAHLKDFKELRPHA